MAIKCYFMTPQKYKIPNLKTRKNRKGLRKKEGMQKYNFYFNYPNSSKYSHRLFS